MRIDFIPPERIHGGVWEQVRNGLNAILAICHEEWLAEDVYLALKTRRASLYQFSGGFFVAELMLSPFNGARRLNVWCLFTAPMVGDEFEDVLIAEFERIAAQEGCCAIRFVSPRQGWGRKLKGKFQEVGVIYERKVYV